MLVVGFARRAGSLPPPPPALPLAPPPSRLPAQPPTTSHHHDPPCRQAARLRQQRYSARNLVELNDVPEVDETVAVGSLTGKFKLHFKAFSRKVARSLSFNKGQGGAIGTSSPGPNLSDGSSTSSGSRAGSPLPPTGRPPISMVATSVNSGGIPTGQPAAVAAM